VTAPATSSSTPGPAALQRVAVHVALSSRGELLVGTGGVLPFSVLRHGESPAAGAQRALAALQAPPARTGAPLEIRDAVRPVAHGGGDVAVHTVHMVLAAEVTDHAVRDATRAGRWVPEAAERPLVADADVPVGEEEFARLAPPGDGVERPVLRQRLAAYAVVVSADDEILLTRLSSVTPSPGRWTLPGGGVDHGEHPVAAAVREVHEETGMDVDVDALVDVGSEHFTGRSPKGVLEDFHALRVLVTATAREVRAPEVLDVGGSTDLGCWVPLDEAAGLGLVGVAHRGVQIAQRRRSATLRS